MRRFRNRVRAYIAWRRRGMSHAEARAMSRDVAFWWSADDGVIVGDPRSAWHWHGESITYPGISPADEQRVHEYLRRKYGPEGPDRSA